MRPFDGHKRPHSSPAHMLQRPGSTYLKKHCSSSYPIFWGRSLLGKPGTRRPPLVPSTWAGSKASTPDQDCNVATGMHWGGVLLEKGAGHTSQERGALGIWCLPGLELPLAEDLLSTDRVPGCHLYSQMSPSPGGLSLYRVTPVPHLQTRDHLSGCSTIWLELRQDGTMAHLMS